MSKQKIRNWTLTYCAGGALLLVWLGGDDPAAMVKPARIGPVQPNPEAL